MRYTTHLNLKKPDPDNFVMPDPFNDNSDILDEYLYEQEQAIAEQAEAVDAVKANKPTITTGTLLASGWNTSAKTYSFASTYPSATYDLEIEPGQTCTEAQLSAWTRAKLVGSATSNVVTAVGEVPTVDIPIIIKAVVK